VLARSLNIYEKMQSGEMSDSNGIKRTTIRRGRIEGAGVTGFGPADRPFLSAKKF